MARPETTRSRCTQVVVCGENKTVLLSHYVAWPMRLIFSTENEACLISRTLLEVIQILCSLQGFTYKAHRFKTENYCMCCFFPLSQ